ncbi:MAG: prolyl oligopeptidase family serine peptidase [Gemmatimonadota bacterium]
MPYQTVARGFTRPLRVLAAAVLLVTPLTAQNSAAPPEAISKEGWLTPPPEIANVVLAPRYLNVSLSNPSPNKKWFLRTVSENMPTQALFAKPHFYLGGLQVDPKANRARTLTTRGSQRIELFSPEDGKTVTIQAPAGSAISSASWSAEGTQVVFVANFENASHIFVADATTGRARQITKTPLLATQVTAPEIAASGKRLFAVQVPDGRGAAPEDNGLKSSPMVRVTSPAKNPQRTHNPGGLLEFPIDQARLEYFTTGQLVAIDVANGAVTKIGQPTMIRGLDASPDGNYVRVTTMVKPFSYIVPTNSFGTIEEIWSVDGKTKVELSKQPLREGIPIDSTERNMTTNEKRSLAWHPKEPGMLYLLQEPAPARAGGQPAAAAGDDAPAGGRGGQQRRPDRLMHWLPPFDANSAKVVYQSDTRMNNVRFSDDMQVLFISEGAAAGGGRGGAAPPADNAQGGGAGAQVHEFAVYLNEPTRKYTIVRYRPDDFYNQPGTLLTKGGGGGGGGRGGGGGGGGGGASVSIVQLSSDQSAVYLQGTQYSKNPQVEAPRPFLDKVTIKTGQKERVFQSAPDVAESLELLLDDDANRMIITRESPTVVPDSYLRERNGQVRKLTNNKDYSPEITNAPRKLIEVTRPSDGFKFWVRVTLPPNMQAGTKPPAMFWFYPREFESQDAYDRGNRAYNKNAFPNVSVRDMDILTKLGYTVVEPDAPIIGAAGRMNDNYVNDLRNNLAATIDELDRLGYADRTRLGVGGHSYGGFSTVNAMVHTPFFRAGIAGDGNYNRTLTPNAFQSERRLLWDARETYISMSPFLYANNLTGALLLYHGLADMNVGTDPINSIRLFNALEGLGKTASLYMYPYEDHGPATKETNLDMWARWVAWLDTYVKNPKKDQPKVTTN